MPTGLFLRKTRKPQKFVGFARIMRPTQGVSYPRSGHSIVYHYAARYFGEAFIYCDINNKMFCGCESVPCVNPDRSFAKNHDFGVQNGEGMPIIPSERYLIQYRSPVRSIVSDYYLHRYRNILRHRKSQWQKFALNSIVFWNRFIDKWVLNFPSDADAPLFCSYESLISDPEARMGEILAYLGGGPLDEDAMHQILERKPIVERNSISKFRHYDAGFFRELEELASGRMAKLGLPSFEQV